MHSELLSSKSAVSRRLITYETLSMLGELRLLLLNGTAEESLSYMTEAEIKTEQVVACRPCVAVTTYVMAIPFMKLIMISGLIASFYASVHAADLSNDSLPTVHENMATHKAVLVDVREPKEWKEGHIEGAISLPLSSLKQGIDASTLEKEIPKDKIVYTHCVMGVRALKAANMLEKLGYKVRPLKAGYEDFVKAGFEKAAN